MEAMDVKTVEEFLDHFKDDPNFYCNAHIAYCKNLGYDVIRNIELEPDGIHYDVTYTFIMPESDITQFLLKFPDAVNVV